ncbi:MAG: hypothetical protein HYW25_03585 [Candidatus Aenigmarchaeota archaeon]|nr:hypothetical protein [Candidatus Aenigmarchaeota archaeon]
MGLFSKIFGSFSKKKESGIPDEEIRSHVLGEYPPAPPEEFQGGPPLPPEMPWQETYAKTAPNFPMPREEMGDVQESLRIIENQLATIRAQTETINERLKNMEFLLKNRQAVRY